MLELSPEEYSLILSVLAQETLDEYNPAIDAIRALHNRIDQSFKEVYPLDHAHHQILFDVIAGRISKDEMIEQVKQINDVLKKGSKLDSED